MARPDGDRVFPPIAWLTTASLASVVVGGILMASYAPRKAPLGVATALLVLAVILLSIAAGLLSHVKDFAWSTFTKVFKWALLAYIVEAAMIEFAFVRNHTSGSSLLIISAMLVIFGVSVPTTIAFTVARYADA
ncbi:MAG TPA: hypothetical protein VIJ86_00965 [Acidimicrobiales bacterium]